MAELNHFAIAAGLDATLGPTLKPHHGQFGSAELAVQISMRLRQGKPALVNWRRHHRCANEYAAALAGAFGAAGRGFSVDRVLTDPAINREFIQVCRERGIDDNAFRLNLALIGLRKHNKLKAKSARSTVPDQWRYAVASEVAARMMFYQYGASVDTTLAHPKLVEEFDRIAASITPGFTPFEYRWAALNMRKKGSNVKLRPKAINELEWSRDISFTAWERMPSERGVYTLFEQEACLYVAGTENIHDSIEGQQRITSVLGSELWRPNPARMSWNYVAMPGSQSDYRFGVVRSLVGQWKPVFNIPRGEDRRRAA